MYIRNKAPNSSRVMSFLLKKIGSVKYAGFELVSLKNSDIIAWPF